MAVLCHALSLTKEQVFSDMDREVAGDDLDTCGGSSRSAPRAGRSHT